MKETERERETSNIRKMLVCGHVRRKREGLLGDLQDEEVCVYVYVCVCLHTYVWIDSGVGQRPESTKPMLEIMHTPSSRRVRARKNRNMAVASHALFALLFCTTIPPDD